MTMEMAPAQEGAGARRAPPTEIAGRGGSQRNQRLAGVHTRRGEEGGGGR